MAMFTLSSPPSTTNTTMMMEEPHQHQQQQHQKIIKRQKKSTAATTALVEDDNNSQKPKRKRISPEQFSLLTELFQQTDTPSHELRERLAKRLDMTNREVQVWFQNRRAKVNRSRLQEQDQQRATVVEKVQEEALTSPNSNKKVKFNYWSSNTPPTTTTNTTTTSSSSSASSSPSLLPHDLIYFPSDVTPIDILATAAAYVQQWDEDERRKRKLIEEEQVRIVEQESVVVEQQAPIKKHKSWRPWL